MNKQILLCAISNVQSGNCSEDCAFCTQSARYKTGIDAYKFKDIDSVVQEAKKARAVRAIGFCLVTSGTGLDSKKTEYLSKVAATVKKEVDGLFIISSAGIADTASLSELKKSGVDSYNHNLETSREFYPTICTTHSWDDRYSTCENAREAGLMLCVGGIFGLGESDEDRKSLFKSLQSLKPMSSPINFYMPNNALPIKECSVDTDKALDIIREAKAALPDTVIMSAGGRELVFKDRQHEIFDAGCQAIIIGDYLTASGQEPMRDMELLRASGLEPLKECPFIH